MAVTLENGTTNILTSQSVNKKNKKNLNLKNNCHAIIEKCEVPVVEKRKRGRPRKIVINKDEIPPIALNMSKENSVGLKSSLKLEDSCNTPTIVKRGRGRPRKNEIVPNIAPSQIVSNPTETNKTAVKKNETKINAIKKTEIKKVETKKTETKKAETKKTVTKKTETKKTEIKKTETKKTETKKAETKKTEIKKAETKKTETKKPATNESATKKSVIKKTITKKRGRKKNALNTVKKHIQKKKIPTLKKKNILKVLIKSKLSKPNANTKSQISKKNSSDKILINANSISNTLESVNYAQNILTEPVSYSKCVTLERSDSPEYTTIIKIKTEPVCEDKENIFMELNEVNWDEIPTMRTRVNSVISTPTRKRISIRRNSLPDNFAHINKDRSKITDDDGYMKSWKSLSYLIDGPNILFERFMYKELDRKFRSELKRSRSFPNCLMLDTITWRFLIRQQRSCAYDSDDEESDTDTRLINELSDTDEVYNRQYRSKSVSVEPYSNKMKTKDNRMYRSLENLNGLCSTNNLQITSVQMSSGVCKLNNGISEKESEGKIRRSKRLHTKFKQSDMLEDEYFLKSVVPKLDNQLPAEQIRQENDRQLSEARKNDPELDKKLKKLNFTLITNNMFRPHRKNMSEYSPAEAQELRRLKHRRVLNSETTYVCHCTYSKKDFLERKPGCSSECINRILNIECGANCSLKGFCTNKQFQNKQFQGTEIRRTPNKGYGVFALEDIQSGAFIDEYMGEVIDQHEMIKRMKTKLYMNNNYMVQLRHDEIIDATRKGNITRFINHSCDPNCVAEKWNVLGESRMGFFCQNPIKKGEEITFDYSFEIFGDAAEQKCYCGSSKCRGYISKKSRAGDQSSSDESDECEDIGKVTKLEECVEKKKLTKTKRMSNKDKNRLRELDQQLTDISKLKNKNRSDLENSTLNLNKLMVHITDSMSRSHILKFIRENDFNCKRLFMNFNGLSIIHSWMSSNNNEHLKLEILQTLSELPITNRNTITKSKVLDIVAEWANIPNSIKEVIENLEYPESKIVEHSQEINKLLPDETDNSFIQSARILWKKWIILKMVFKIPKLDRPKEVDISDVNESVLPQTKLESKKLYFRKPITSSNHRAKINHEDIKNKFSSISLQKNITPESVKTSSIETFGKMINHQKLINNPDKKKPIFEWNKKNWEYSTFKTGLGNSSTENNSYSNLKRSSISMFKVVNHEQYEIPTIECGMVVNKNQEWNTTNEICSIDNEVSTNAEISISTNNILPKTKTNHIYYPIEEIITSQNVCLPSPIITDMLNVSTFDHIINMYPPYNETNQQHISFGSIMRPENVFYDAQHPSIEEQINSMSKRRSVIPHKTLFDTSITKQPGLEKNEHRLLQTNKRKKSFKQKRDGLNKSLKKDDKPQIVNNSNQYIIPNSDTSNKAVLQPTNENIQKKLFESCENNITKLYDKSLLDVFNLSNTNQTNQFPIKINTTSFKKKNLTSQLLSRNSEKDLSNLPNLLKFIKIGSNCYQKQLSNIVKISNYKYIDKKNKDDKYQMEDEEDPDILSTTELALNLGDAKLVTNSPKLNIEKILSQQTIELNSKNKFACKIFNGLIKKCSNAPDKFTVKLPQDTKIITVDPNKELELQRKLIPTIQNTLCARLNTEFPRDVINVYKQNIIMKYEDDLDIRKSITKTEENPGSLKNAENTIKKTLKRKMPLPTGDTKNKKLDDSCMRRKNLTKTRVGFDNKIGEAREANISKQEVPFVNQYKKSIEEMTRKRNVPSHTIQSNDLLNTNQDEFKDTPSTSSLDCDEMGPKPLMKCSPFYKDDDLSEDELEHFTTCASSSTNVLISTEVRNKLINSIVDQFNSSRPSTSKTSRANLTDDPIVRDYIIRTQNKILNSNPRVKRKFKLPDSMMSLPPNILRLIPDNQKEIKSIVDFYHAMATVIVKVLDAYVKKNCQQGRIKNDGDFKFLAKRINSNILSKELQVKRVVDLKISDTVKEKVEQYITKYMLKFGSVYKPKKKKKNINK